MATPSFWWKKFMRLILFFVISSSAHQTMRRSGLPPCGREGRLSRPRPRWCRRQGPLRLRPAPPRRLTRRATPSGAMEPVPLPLKLWLNMALRLVKLNERISYNWIVIYADLHYLLHYRKDKAWARRSKGCPSRCKWRKLQSAAAASSTRRTTALCYLPSQA